MQGDNDLAFMEKVSGVSTSFDRRCGTVNFHEGNNFTADNVSNVRN